MNTMQARTMRARATIRANEVGASRRRLRRSRELYCATNGCTSFLESDTARGTATCPICGYERRLN